MGGSEVSRQWSLVIQYFQIRNPKHEARNKFKARNSNDGVLPVFLSFRHLNIGACFGFRASCFEFLKYVSAQSGVRWHLPAEETGEQDFVDTAAEALFAVDRDHRHALIVALKKLGIGIDVDEARCDAMADQQLACVVAQMTALAGEKDDVGHAIILGASGSERNLWGFRLQLAGAC
jgi:hypothetical protein